jgi:hypothetical protein
MLAKGELSPEKAVACWYERKGDDQGKSTKFIFVPFPLLSVSLKNVRRNF